MKLNYDALQELYDTLMFGPVLSSPYAESPIDMAFKECDEKLSESIAFDYLKKLQDRNETLEKELDDAKNRLNWCMNSRDNWRSRAKHAEDEAESLKKKCEELKSNNDKLGDKILELKKEREATDKENSALVSANADLSDRLEKVQKMCEHIDRCWTSQIQENMELRSKIANLQREKKNYETIAKERAELVEDRDAWRRRATYAEKDRDLAKRNSDGWKSRAMHAEKRYAELRKENADLSEKVVDFEKRITELQKKGDDLTKNGEDLQQEIEELKKSRKCHRQLHVGEGARKLWDMLQNVNDTQPDEFDVECESMHDVISMDLDDFLDAYKKWQEKKETDRMRIWLDNFCSGRFCKGCPLESEEYKCGRGYSFRGINHIPDEDIKRYYEKARGCGRYTLKDATFYFDNKPVTMEANVEVVKDLLNAVYGVKPKEEEHKLEYGDAVRVPWRDYDYMYIGPEGNHIRLFNPKTHSVVVVPSTENLPYQGCKIILYNEDDIRKIWKDK